jgi:hypothetical protein
MYRGRIDRRTVSIVPREKIDQYMSMGVRNWDVEIVMYRGRIDRRTVSIVPREKIDHYEQGGEELGRGDSHVHSTEAESTDCLHCTYRGENRYEIKHEIHIWAWGVRNWDTEIFIVQ